MEIDLKRKKEFMLFFQALQEQKDSFYTKEQLVKNLWGSFIRLFPLEISGFIFKVKLVVSFLNYIISGEKFSKQLINLRSTHIVEFNELMSQLEINFEFLNKFNLDLNSFWFADIIDLVDQNCDSFVYK